MKIIKRIKTSNATCFPFPVQKHILSLRQLYDISLLKTGPVRTKYVLRSQKIIYHKTLNIT